MLKFAVCEYQLNSREFANSTRRGALLKVTWPDGKWGVGDLHPWIEFGDEDLTEQLNQLKMGRITKLVEQTIWFAKRDAQARSEKKFLLAGLPKVKNHYLVQNPLGLSDSSVQSIRSEGFQTVKLKLGKDLAAEILWLDRFMRQNPFQIRIDFGSRLTSESFFTFVEKLHESFHSRIEYVEDPFPFDPMEWEKANERLPLALDFEFQKAEAVKLTNPLKPPYRYLIIKPARQDVKKMTDFASKYRLKMVVTSSLDHPIGNIHAMAVAAELKKFNPNTLMDCGCLTHRAYQLSQFAQEIKSQGPFLVQVAGTGVGFDQLLETTHWSPL